MLIQKGLRDGLGLQDKAIRYIYQYPKPSVSRQFGMSRLQPIRALQLHMYFKVRLPGSLTTVENTQSPIIVEDERELPKSSQACISIGYKNFSRTAVVCGLNLFKFGYRLSRMPYPANYTAVNSAQRYAYSTRKGRERGTRSLCGLTGRISGYAPFDIDQWLSANG